MSNFGIYSHQKRLVFFLSLGKRTNPGGGGRGGSFNTIVGTIYNTYAPVLLGSRVPPLRVPQAEAQICSTAEAVSMCIDPTRRAICTEITSHFYISSRTHQLAAIMRGRWGACQKLAGLILKSCTLIKSQGRPGAHGAEDRS